MELAFIVGAVLGGLFGGFFMRYLMIEKSYRNGVEHNRRMQDLLNGQYELGVQRGISKARREYIERDKDRDNMLTTAGAIAGYLHATDVIDIPAGAPGENIMAAYITNIVNNYNKLDYDISFEEHIKSLLIHAFGVNKNG